VAIPVAVAGRFAWIPIVQCCRSSQSFGNIPANIVFAHVSLEFGLMHQVSGLWTSTTQEKVATDAMRRIC
jgi:hypothetical protein